MHPSLWNRVNLDSSDHSTFFHCSTVQYLSLKPFFWLTSLIIGFLRLHRSLGPIPSVLFTMGMLLLSLLYTAVSSAVDFYLLIQQTFKWSPIAIIQDFFPPHFFLKNDGSPLSFQGLTMCWTVINPILAVSAMFLVVFYAWCRPIIWPLSNIFWWSKEWEAPYCIS